MKRVLLAALLLLPLGACREEQVATVPPVSLTADAVGRYCGMNLVEHKGPKGQVILAEGLDPFWFSSARDTVAFSMMPEEPKDYAALYVSDMGRAQSWDDPGADNWVDATQAFYVVESSAQGGMGGQELVPFSTTEAAEAFAADKGGTVLAFADLTFEQVLGDGTAGEDFPDVDPAEHEHATH
ncbi:nitrous oxide reductase accessory protein NosL [uncultured Paracoccus sp.]|uniref:nitrous oxide reductase accessory protein NosL n=1 Tax=uncultured Paracoccus sp. TaxID=189685 RepID=UPI0026281CB0|nr:nitrous oxide reductase accessory protein NosL [uncultured Paracoccus sp.]